MDAADVAEPYAFEAVTVNVYAVPFVVPVTAIGDAPEPEAPAGLDVTENDDAPVPAAPAVYVRETAPVVLLNDAVPIVGAPGGAPGVIELDAADVLEPYAFDAVTVNVYAVPFVRPETVIGDAPVPVRLPGVDVAV